MTLTWNSDYEIADPANITIVQERIGFSFPEDFISIISRFQGGKPNKTKLVLNESIHLEFESLLTFLTFDELDILDRYNSVKNTLGRYIVPIGIEKENGLFCIDFKDDKKEIVYWNGSEVIIICKSFTEFEGLLERT